MAGNMFKYPASRPSDNPGILRWQIVIVAVTLAVLVFAPPAKGQMMLVPLTGAAARNVTDIALQNTNRLVSTGTIDGSLIILGHRPAILHSLLDRGVLVLAVPNSGCG